MRMISIEETIILINNSLDDYLKGIDSDTSLNFYYLGVSASIRSIKYRLHNVTDTKHLKNIIEFINKQLNNYVIKDNTQCYLLGLIDGLNKAKVIIKERINYAL